LENHPSLLQNLAYRRLLGKVARRLARAGTSPYGHTDPQSSAGIVDSQSVKSTGVGGEEERGYDGGKKVKGTKRHLLVDTQGLVLKAKVHAANVMDWDGIKMLLERADVEFPRLKHLWLDSAYRGEDTREKIGWRRL